METELVEPGFHRFPMAFPFFDMVPKISHDVLNEGDKGKHGKRVLK